MLPSKKKIVLKKAKKRTIDVEECVDLDNVCMFPLIDLRSKKSLATKVNKNALITSKLQQLIDVTKAKKAATNIKKEKTKHSYRIRSFQKALITIQEHPKPISGRAEAIALDGIGKGIGDRVHEILITGSLKEIEDTISSETRSILDLCQITGIGEARARLLVELGVVDVDDLITKYKNGTIKITKNQLTKHIAVGLDYYYDINERFSWKEADKIAQYIKKTMSVSFPDLIVKICGSYRRHKETCGDIDVLICHPDLKSKSDIDESKMNYLSDVVNTLTKAGFITAHLTENGKTKFMGIASIDSSSPGRRIDIRFIESNAMGAAMLYFTGSGTFNKIMRYIANDRGFTLNEYGLYYYHNGIKCDIIPTRSEKDIFRALKFRYLEPWERDI
jgi:DNA polymerase/3'-5' exonuclease PolX